MPHSSIATSGSGRSRGYEERRRCSHTAFIINFDCAWHTRPQKTNVFTHLVWHDAFGPKPGISGLRCVEDCESRNRKYSIMTLVRCSKLMKDIGLQIRALSQDLTMAVIQHYDSGWLQRAGPLSSSPGCPVCFPRQLALVKPLARGCLLECTQHIRRTR